ncbi:hypothetical protein DL89DRAFT_258279 [Linderina pennispora]|uniref:Vesicle transport protein USE1 n=1 Tax=Linderina pennispora TaxID=61395 RepID=A0A1Y1W7C6_9FUNG|nr:uncharacterized protein DL89DRAFT_258279 [Linderina pennispora]ORX69228.1 hypothetical protein DL89DRAFT_258279 [Linderina pennispora]
MAVTLTDEGVQLADGFTEPLDAEQLRRIANIERIVASALEGDLPEQCKSLAEDVNEKASPWIERKTQMMQWLKQRNGEKQPAQQAKEEEKEEEKHSDAVVVNDACTVAAADAAETPESRHTQSLGLEGSAPRAIKREHSSLSGKRQGRVCQKCEAERRHLVPVELLGEMDGLRRRGVVPDTVEGVERLLKSQRSTQEDLTNDLVQMASILKKNTRAFGDVIERDKHVVDETAEALGSNLASMDKQGSRLSKYRKQAWGTTGITWLAVLVVVSVFFMLVLFMRIAPKRY